MKGANTSEMTQETNKKITKEKVLNECRDCRASVGEI